MFSKPQSLPQAPGKVFDRCPGSTHPTTLQPLSSRAQESASSDLGCLSGFSLSSSSEQPSLTTCLLLSSPCSLQPWRVSGTFYKGTRSLTFPYLLNQISTSCYTSWANVSFEKLPGSFLCLLWTSDPPNLGIAPTWLLKLDF